MNPAQLSSATIADLAEIMALEESSFLNDAWSAQMMAEELNSPHSQYLQLRIGDQLAGYAGLRHIAGAPDADIQTITIAEPFRGSGLGRQLLRELMLRADSGGARDLFLEVRDDNLAAQKLYLSEGFSEIARRVGYYQPDGVDALVMQAKLPQLRDRFAQHPESLKTHDQQTLASASAAAIDHREPSAQNKPPKSPLVLGIESSCDETGVGIVRGRQLLSNTISSSMAEHARFGGVVPEVAARAHLEAITPAINTALAEAGVTLDELDAIAVTSGPGLSGALMVGVAAAKALAVSLQKPLYAVNHLVGHIAADILEYPGGGGEVTYPTIALLVSGGHTSLLLVRDLTSDVELLGETVDDAAGEAFDKVARLLGLPYPGGPEIDRAADGADPNAIRFPRGLSKASDLAEHRFDFSFSGLKTAVARWVEQRERSGEPIPVAEVAASFREAVVDVLVTKALAACERFEVPNLLLGGGVIANARLRELALARAEAAGVKVRIPPLKLCTDNGAMIAALAAELIAKGHAPSGLGFGADSTLPVTEIQVDEQLPAADLNSGCCDLADLEQTP